MNMTREHRNKKVEVYWNLHRKCWSVRHKGRVLWHTNKVALHSVKWVVQPAGNAKVRREGKKNVHAFARGWVYDLPVHDMGVRPLTYNPHLDNTFVTRKDRKPVEYSQCALLTTNPDNHNVPSALAIGRYQ